MQVRDHRKIAKLMLIQGVSQRELARALGHGAHSYVGRIARGEVRSVSPEVAARIASFFGVGVDDLFLVRMSNNGGHSDQTRSAS